MTDILKFDENGIQKAVEVIRKGGVVLLPTDTVYGIAGDAYSHEVYIKISDLKKRPKDKPFPIQVGKSEDAFYLAKVNLTAMFLMRNFWPGALTIIFEGGKDLPYFLKSNDRVGIRVADSALVQLLLTKIGRPLIITSANKSGDESPVSLEEVKEDVKKGVALILDGGKTSLGKESTVVDVAREVPAILREGVIERNRLRDALLIKKITFICTGNSCRSVMARYYLEKIFKDRGIEGIELDSAGIGTFQGLKASSLTLEVLREEGVDASFHDAKPVTEELVIESDLIVVMGEIHRHFLKERFPESSSKVRLLGDEIGDPIGQGKDVYQRCFSEIKRGLEGLLNEIIQLRKAFVQ